MCWRKGGALQKLQAQEMLSLRIAGGKLTERAEACVKPPPGLLASASSPTYFTPTTFKSKYYYLLYFAVKAAEAQEIHDLPRIT